MFATVMYLLPSDVSQDIAHHLIAAAMIFLFGMSMAMDE